MGDKSCYVGLPKADGAGGREQGAKGSGPVKGGVNEEYAGGYGHGGNETYAGGIPKGQTPSGMGGGQGGGSVDRSCYAGLPK